MTMTMLMLPLNHQLQIITLVVMFLLVTIFNDVFLDVFDGVLLVVRVGWSAHFADLARVRPEDVLFFFRNPAFDEQEFGVLCGGGELVGGVGEVQKKGREQRGKGGKR